MAYRRYVRRRASRRKTLSNYRIATRTSAKAQSRQIYALKRRINVIQRRTKPEILIARRTISAPLAFTGNGIGRALWTAASGTASAIVPPLGTATIDLNPAATSSPTNNFARLLSFTLYGNFYYTEALTGTDNPIRLRIVIAQLKATRAEAPDQGDVFAYAGNSTTISAVYGPLQTGISRTMKVLSDRHYTLSYQRPNIVIRTPLKYLLSYYRDSNSTSSGSSSTSETVSKGGIYVFYAIYGANFTNCTLYLEGKLAYTDA